MCPESWERSSNTANVRPSSSISSATNRSGIVRCSFIGVARLQEELVLEELGVRREGAVAALAGRAPTELLVEPSPTSVPREHPEPGTTRSAAAQVVEHEVVRSLGGAAAPVLESDPEVQELVGANRSESDDGVAGLDHVAVRVRALDLLEPPACDRVVG